jgi:hypothetical protein
MARARDPVQGIQVLVQQEAYGDRKNAHKPLGTTWKEPLADVVRGTDSVLMTTNGKLDRRPTGLIKVASRRSDWNGQEFFRPWIG